MLFPSILKRLQLEVSKHLGDTSSGAVFVIWVEEASCTSLDVFYLVNVILLVLQTTAQYSKAERDKGDVGCIAVHS